MKTAQVFTNYEGMVQVTIGNHIQILALDRLDKALAIASKAQKVYVSQELQVQKEVSSC